MVNIHLYIKIIGSLILKFLRINFMKLIKFLYVVVHGWSSCKWLRTFSNTPQFMAAISWRMLPLRSVMVRGFPCRSSLAESPRRKKSSGGPSSHSLWHVRTCIRQLRARVQLWMDRRRSFSGAYVTGCSFTGTDVWSTTFGHHRRVKRFLLLKAWDF
jgi:hypothetical protein